MLSLPFSAASLLGFTLSSVLIIFNPFFSPKIYVVKAKTHFFIHLKKMGFVSTHHYSHSTSFCPKIYPSSSSNTKLIPTKFHPSLPTLKPVDHKRFVQKTHASFDFQSSLPDRFSINQKSFFSWKNEESSVLIPFSTKSSGSGEEDSRALETVLKLYNAIKERNVHELSDVIGEECRCVCNFISFFQPFYGKKQVLEFFDFLLGYMGKHIEFVVQPTLHDGMNVGVHWRLEWDKTHVPLGKGFSFYMCHVYQGKMLIRNIEIFMEPLLHIEPLRLKVIGYLMPVLDKIGLANTKQRTRVIHLLFSLVFIVAFLVMFNLS